MPFFHTMYESVWLSEFVVNFTSLGRNKMLQKINGLRSFFVCLSFEHFDKQNLWDFSGAFFPPVEAFPDLKRKSLTSFLLSDVQDSLDYILQKLSLRLAQDKVW